VNEKTREPAEDLAVRVLKEQRVVGLANDTALMARDGREVPIEDSAAPILDAAGNVTGVVLVFHDVTQKRQAQAALRESEEKFRSAFANAAIGFAMTAPDGRFADANATYCAITGYSVDELRALAFPQLIHPDDQAGNMELMGRIFSGEIADFAIENRYVRKDGRPVWVRKSVSLVRSAQGVPQWTIVLIEDITMRKRAEEAVRQRTLELQQLTGTLERRVQDRTGELANANEALRNLSSRLLSAHEEERKRVAGEIHDVIGACLGAIKFKVEGALRSAADGAPHPLTDSLKVVIPVIQEGIEECRRIQQDLRPSMLDDLGLLPTLSWFCRRFQTIYSGIRVEQLIAVSEEEIPGPRKIVLYRVTQEAMNNIAKHSKADVVRLCLQKTDGRIELMIEDNGKGFDAGQAFVSENARRGLGLTSMKERVEFSGGSFQVESVEGKGTTIRASWAI
jgi:PAS domain S-box-containing protein